MHARLSFRIRRRQYWGILIMGLLLTLGEILFFLIPKNEPVFTDLPNHWDAISKESSSIILTEFDPNDLDAAQWKKLGFSDRQAATILKYKKIVGGRFQSKDQLKKCYAISEEKFVEIQSFILLPEHSSDRKDSGFYTQYSKKELLVSSKFNPDSFVALDWQKMGFSEKQASAIDKYKQYLGGSFVSKEKFKDCFIISEENYKKLSPFLLLPEKTPASFSQKYPKKEDTKKNYSLAPFDPNSLDAAGWEAIGFSEKQAQVIVNYRERNLRGQFRNLDDIKSCFVISEEKFKELLPFLHLKVSQEIPVAEHKKYEVTVEKPTDFSKIDLNKISYKQLIEYGFSEKDAAMLLSFRKKLGGFVHKQQVIDTYEIDKNLAEKLSQETQLNADVVAKYTLTEAPEEWLKTHPYFKFSAEKIIYFRISNPDDRKILKFLKLKPEYETKMKWYLKSE